MAKLDSPSGQILPGAGHSVARGEWEGEVPDARRREG
jgi:hypothetical protein